MRWSPGLFGGVIRVVYRLLCCLILGVFHSTAIIVRFIDSDDAPLLFDFDLVCMVIQAVEQRNSASWSLFLSIDCYP